MARLKKHLFSRTSQASAIYLQDIIKPLYIVTSLFGLFPYSIKFVNSKSCFVIIRKSLYANSLCGVTVCLIISAFLILHIQEIVLAREQINLTKAVLTQANYILELVVLIVFCFAAYICAFLNRIRYITILNQIVSTWSKVPAHIKSKRSLANLRIQVNVVCMGGLLVSWLLELGLNFARRDSLWKMVLVTFTFSLPQTLQFVTLALHHILIMMDIALMKNIKRNCYLILQTDNFMELRNRSLLSFGQMELMYKKVFEIKTNINLAFQAPILLTVFQSFHSMVSEAHIIYHGLVVQNSLTLQEGLNCGVWVLYQILKIYCIAYGGHSLKTEALNICQILHDIPTERCNTRNFMEIQHFSAMMFYQNIELNVCGYFPLDATLIFNTLTSATMYLIILVQFDK